MTVGVGLYAPCMAMIGALGMNIQAAFPVMMGSCAFLMPACGIKFVKRRKIRQKSFSSPYHRWCNWCIDCRLIVKSLPITILTWVVIVVMIYTAIVFFKDATKAA